VHIKARTIFGETDSCFQIIWTEDLKWWLPIVKISTNIIHIFLSDNIDSTYYKDTMWNNMKSVCYTYLIKKSICCGNKFLRKCRKNSSSWKVSCCHPDSAIKMVYCIYQWQ
jgi:hypothetical protein